MDKKSVAFFKNIEKIIGQWHNKQVVLGILNSDTYKNQASILMTSCKDDLLNLERTIHSF